MKILFMAIFFLWSSFSCGDECTEHLDAYMNDLMRIVISKSADKESKHLAIDKIKKVNVQRETLTDCEIRSNILGSDKVIYKRHKMLSLSTC